METIFRQPIYLVITGGVGKEYVDKARVADQQYGGVEAGRVGPVENKLLK